MNLLHVTSHCISFSHSQIGQIACVPKPNSCTGHVPFKKGTCRLVGETMEVCHLAHWFVPVIKLYSVKNLMNLVELLPKSQARSYSAAALWVVIAQ